MRKLVLPRIRKWQVLLQIPLRLPSRPGLSAPRFRCTLQRSKSFAVPGGAQAQAQDELRGWGPTLQGSTLAPPPYGPGGRAPGRLKGRRHEATKPRVGSGVRLAAVGDSRRRTTIPRRVEGSQGGTAAKNRSCVSSPRHARTAYRQPSRPHWSDVLVHTGSPPATPPRRFDSDQPALHPRAS